MDQRFIAQRWQQNCYILGVITPPGRKISYFKLLKYVSHGKKLEKIYMNKKQNQPVQQPSINIILFVFFPVDT